MTRCGPEYFILNGSPGKVYKLSTKSLGFNFNGLAF